MTAHFLCGTLCHPPLLETVLGRAPDATPDALPDAVLHRVPGQRHAQLVPRPDAQVSGLRLDGLGETEQARLAFYHACLGQHPAEARLASGLRAQVFLPAAVADTGGPWSHDDWLARDAGVVTATARDAMARFGETSPDLVRRRYPMMLVRGASEVRAAQPKPSVLRRVAAAGDVDTIRRSTPYAHFFSVEEHDIRFRRFDGAFSPPVNRAAFISGDAATVLPYDPVRDRVLVVEQFRVGPHARGDANPWFLEAVAGRIDPFETPEDCARREACEEAGVDLQALIPVAQYYPSPGAKTEFLYSFVALCDLPDDRPRLGGMADEAEDIRAHVIGFDRLMQIITLPEGGNGPLILTAMWLAANRDRLRAGG